MANNNREEILRVEHLKQYFKSGSGRNKIVVKAVDDISFSIYKGEVFSLVGESGCGKTTTGRTIIKLYQSTGGEVHFHGTRIISDVKQARVEFKEAELELKAAYNEKIAELQLEVANGSMTQADFGAVKQELTAQLKQDIDEKKEVWRQAIRDRKFERYVDPESLKDAKAFNENSKEYVEIEEQYREMNAELVEEINEKSLRYQQMKNNADTKEEKEEAKALRLEIAELQRELKLNKTRKKQDIQRFKYNLVHRNRLLMRKMQMIFQDPIASLNPRMTVKEIIAEGLRINGLKNEKIIDRKVKEALTTVGLVAEHASRYPHEFSGGQRQRIGIARALVVEPTFIIADEPISALDVSIRAQVINLLNDLREQQGITILFIAHDLSVVKYFSDRVAVMYFGKIVEIGEKNKIFNNPLHPYTLSLIDSIPLPDPNYEKARGKLQRYNPAQEHDYSVEGPTLREVEPDHFVLCNTAEFERYQEKIKANPNKA